MKFPILNGLSTAIQHGRDNLNELTISTADQMDNTKLHNCANLLRGLAHPLYTAKAAEQKLGIQGASPLAIYYETKHTQDGETRGLGLHAAHHHPNHVSYNTGIVANGGDFNCGAIAFGGETTTQRVGSPISFTTGSTNTGLVALAGPNSTASGLLAHAGNGGLAMGLLAARAEEGGTAASPVIASAGKDGIAAGGILSHSPQGQELSLGQWVNQSKASPTQQAYSKHPRD